MSALLDELYRELEINDQLAGYGALTVGMVTHDLDRTLGYVDTAQPATNDAAASFAIIRTQLQSDIALLGPLDPGDPVPDWTRLRSDISRSYEFADRNNARLDSDAAESQARVNALNVLLGKAGDAVKGAAGVAGGLLGGALWPVALVAVVLVIGAAYALAKHKGRIV